MTTAQAGSLTWPCPWPPLRSGPPLAPPALQMKNGPGAVARHLQYEARGTPPEDGRGEGYTDGLDREVGTWGDAVREDRRKEVSVRWDGG